MIFWIWWLEIWSSWLTVLDAATPPPRGPPEHPPDGGTVVNLAHWRRTHPTPGHNGWAA